MLIIINTKFINTQGWNQSYDELLSEIELRGGQCSFSHFQEEYSTTGWAEVVLDAGLLQLMATQQEVDLGIKVDFLINCIHWSGIYVPLALSETLWSGEKCVAQRQDSGRQTDELMLTVAHWYLSILHYISQNWQGNPDCESLHQAVVIITEA